MDAYVAANFPAADLRTGECTASWHSYTFALSPHRLEDLRRDLARRCREWALKVRYNPELSPTEVADFLAGQRPPRARAAHAATPYAVD